MTCEEISPGEPVESLLNLLSMLACLQLLTAISLQALWRQDGLCCHGLTGLMLVLATRLPREAMQACNEWASSSSGALDGDAESAPVYRCFGCMLACLSS